MRIHWSSKEDSVAATVGHSSSTEFAVIKESPKYFASLPKYNAELSSFFFTNGKHGT